MVVTLKDICITLTQIIISVKQHYIIYNYNLLLLASVWLQWTIWGLRTLYIISDYTVQFYNKSCNKSNISSDDTPRNVLSDHSSSAVSSLKLSGIRCVSQSVLLQILSSAVLKQRPSGL